MWSVEDYILEGICEGCDQDPAKCYNLGYCFYDHENDEGEDDAKETT